MLEIETKIQETKKLTLQNLEIDKTIRQNKEEIFESFKKEFKSLLDDNELQKSKWDPYELDREFQMLLRSMLKRNAIYKLGNKLSLDYWYLTQEHGLKYPRTHRSHNFVPGVYGTQEPKLIEMIFETGNGTINFVELAGRSDIDVRKFEKFLSFLKEVISLFYAWRENNKFLETKKTSGLSGLRSYSDIEDFESFMKNAPIIKTGYLKWVSDVESFTQRRSDLLIKMHEFNKPYRLFLVLKKKNSE